MFKIENNEILLMKVPSKVMRHLTAMRSYFSTEIPGEDSVWIVSKTEPNVLPFYPDDYKGECTFDFPEEWDQYKNIIGGLRFMIHEGTVWIANSRTHLPVHQIPEEYIER